LFKTDDTERFGDDAVTTGLRHGKRVAVAGLDHVAKIKLT
jgi:hypothetical protein